MSASEQPSAKGASPWTGSAPENAPEPFQEGVPDPGEHEDPEVPVEPVQRDGELAEPGQRLLARIVDTLIVGVPVVLAVRAVLPEREAELALPPAIAAGLFLYEWLQLGLWGRTLGKRFAGVQVLRMESGDPVGWWRALPRTAVYALPIAAQPVPILGVLAGFFWVVNAAAMYEGERRQPLHERLVGTLVVKRTGGLRSGR